MLVDAMGHAGLSLGEVPDYFSFPTRRACPRRRALFHEILISLPNSLIVSVSYCRILSL